MEMVKRGNSRAKKWP